MATKPTRQQQQACDQFAEALFLITQGARLDGRGKLDAADLTEIVRRVAQASSAFSAEEIIARTLERRVGALGLPSSTVELLTLMETDVKPLEMTLLGDDEVKALVEAMREELGDV